MLRDPGERQDLGGLARSPPLSVWILKMPTRPSTDCREQLIKRLELSEDIPEDNCPKRVTLFQLDGSFYYLVANIGPNL